MRASDECIKLIKHFEGVRTKPYQDCVGLWTVGVGHLIGNGKSLPKEWNRTFSMEEVDAILKQDLVRFEHGVQRLCPVSMSQSVFDMLVSFSFNTGLGCLQRSRVRQNINRGDVKNAIKILLQYDKAGGKTVRGLTIRRRAEAALGSQ
jgi:lysozyme